MFLRSGRSAGSAGRLDTQGLSTTQVPVPAGGGGHFPGEGLGTGFLSLEDEPHASLFFSGRLNITYPMLFKLTNKNSDRMTHCGVLEFVADEGICYLPHWVSGPRLPRGAAGTPSACAQSCLAAEGRASPQTSRAAVDTVRRELGMAAHLVAWNPQPCCF